MTTERPELVRRATRAERPRRLVPLVVIALVALVAGVLVPQPADDTAELALSVGMLEPSMIEMLDNDGGSGVVTLAELRDDLLGSSYAGGDGAGVDVAVIDTGVAPVDGLDAVGKVSHGPDLSFESESPQAAYLDTYGHGTHMAGIIAGERAGQEGIAPGAGIVSVKVAGNDGVTTVPQVVSAIDWVVEHRAADGLNIRVLNLSLGEEGISSHEGDLLSAAVERAWDAGILVVVAAGNSGDDQSHLDSPAVSPYVLAVGAVDSTSGDDDDDDEDEDDDRDERPVPSWSAIGDGTRNPDVVAPGRSIASYRVPGSTIDEATPAARHGDHLFRGSGTSQAAAVASGLAALLIAEHPELSPDQVKASIEDRAFRLEDVSSRRQGEGHVHGRNTLTYSPVTSSPPQAHPKADGPDDDIEVPELTADAWQGGTWSGATWSGATWSGATWSGATWSGAVWSGATWSGATWSGATWSGATWSGATWSGAVWSGATWSGAVWSGQGWE